MQYDLRNTVMTFCFTLLGMAVAALMLLPGTASAGIVRIFSDPAGASIYVDGKYEGDTQENASTDIPFKAAGKYKIKLEKKNEDGSYYFHEGNWGRAKVKYRNIL